MNEGEGRAIAVTGASGLVGSHLRGTLSGRRIVRLVRSKERTGPDAIYWNPDEGEIDAASLEGVGAVVHLAGENIAAGRWTDARKARIMDSRVQGTGLLARTLASLKQPPDVLVSSSGVNFYGSRTDGPVDEDSPSGDGFLAEVCREWEAATQPAADAGIRVACMRTGVVLSSEGGALTKMLTPFKLGLGGRIGSGEQFMSWIHIADLTRAIGFVIGHPPLSGPVNAVAPNPVTNGEFTKTLGRVLGRPTALPVPGAAVKLGLGQELAEEALLGGQQVIPRRLQHAGFEWQFPELEPALRHLLGR